MAGSRTGDMLNGTTASPPVSPLLPQPQSCRTDSPTRLTAPQPHNAVALQLYSPTALQLCSPTVRVRLEEGM